MDQTLRAAAWDLAKGYIDLARFIEYTERKKEMGMRVIMLRPLQKPEVMDIEKGLASMQQLVDGYIEALYPFDDDVAIVCNEEGKFNGSSLNRALRDEDGNIYDIIHGPAFICGIDKTNFCSIPEDLIEKYLGMFARPEMYFLINGEIVAIPIA